MRDISCHTFCPNINLSYYLVDILKLNTNVSNLEIAPEGINRAQRPGQLIVTLPVWTVVHHGDSFPFLKARKGSV